MKQRATMHTGSLGSTIHVLRADADTITALAAVDWNRHFAQVCLDPARGLISLMSPSFPHEKLSKFLDDVVEAAGEMLAGAVEVLRSTRLRRQGDPPGTGMEPDCAFYIGRRAREFRAVLAKGEAGAVAFIERIAPDLVVEVEITHADKDKIDRYAELGGAGAVAAAPSQGHRGASRGAPCLARRGARRSGSTPRRCSKGSRRTICAKRCKRCEAARHATIGPGRWSAS